VSLLPGSEECDARQVATKMDWHSAALNLVFMFLQCSARYTKPCLLEFRRTLEPSFLLHVLLRIVKRQNCDPAKTQLLRSAKSATALEMTTTSTDFLRFVQSPAWFWLVVSTCFNMFQQPCGCPIPMDWQGFVQQVPSLMMISLLRLQLCNFCINR